MKSNAKQGFGLLEVLVSALVLGFLLVGLNIMQKGNREAVLRIRTRDAAQIIAQDFLDSLSSLGIYSIGEKGDIITEKKVYEWKGQNNTTASIEYDIKAEITETDEVKEQSNLIGTAVIKHPISKTINLTVSWPFKNSAQPQSITVSRIIK